MREEDRELVTADAEGAVGAAQGVVQQGAEAAQDAIAVGVAARVVDRLELVDVDEEERQRDVVAQGGRDLPIELLVEGAMVAQPGERVAQRIGEGRLVANLELGLRRHQRGERAPHRQRSHGQGGGGAGGDRDRRVVANDQGEAVHQPEGEHAEHDAAEHAAGQNAGRGHRPHGGPIR